MAEYTTNLNLEKPFGGENLRRQVINDNMDKIDAAVGGKADKISGKGLSTEDYTTEEKSKLAGITAGANVKSTTGNTTYYVDASTGDNANDGLTSGTAFATIQYAINLLPQVINHTVSIMVAAGTYTHTILSGFIGKGSIFLMGDGNPLPVINSELEIKNCSINTIDVRDINVTGRISCARIKNAYFYNCNITAITALTEGILCGCSNITITRCTISNQHIAILAVEFGTVISENNSGTGNDIGLYCQGGSIIKIGTQPDGTTSESTNRGGEIR